MSHLEGSFALINLSGKSVNCRYTEKNKKELIESRTKTTSLLAEAISKLEAPPRVWVNASSTAIYGFSDQELDERAGPGADFPAQICVQWEEAFWNTEVSSTRKLAWRLGVVLQKDRGLILPFRNLVKFGAGARIGSGKQYFTWIHEEDFLNAALWTINNENADGYFNLSSPEPVTNETFMRALSTASGSRFTLPLPGWVVRVGGMITGTEPYLVLDGRRIVPSRLLELGFKFRYPEINRALKTLVTKNGNTDGV